MKKIFGIAFVSIILIVFGFNYKSGINASTFYKVYLNDEVIGVVSSKTELEDYIDKQSKSYKKKYGVNKVYAPIGLEIKKINTYDSLLSKVEDVYELISKKASFTIRGYEFNIKKDDKVLKIYTTSEDIFESSIDSIIKSYVGTEEYEAYLNSSQEQILTTGSIIENVYVEEDITVKKTNISVDEKIYIDASSLSQFLLFGEDTNQEEYTVKSGDTIESVSYDNQISVEEFLISNPNFTSSKNLLFPGQVVLIGITDPKISVVEELYSIQDMEINYQEEYRYDANLSSEYSKVVQEGENGLERVTQRTKKINGVINYIDPISNEELQPAINKIILKGKKVMSGVGSKGNWLWPTNSGYTISSGWSYRINPINGLREIHQALDIAGTGYGSPIYAVTNGVVSESSYRYQDGNYVCLNHNNGYYTCYAHMSKRNVSVNQVVERGNVIGYVGSSGWATGPHLHFEVWIGKPWYGGYRINPYYMY